MLKYFMTQKKTPLISGVFNESGSWGIRTPGTVTRTAV